jgi:hypothetical protein
VLIDLNARRAARASANGNESVTVRLGDRDYELVNMIPIRVLELVGDNDVAGAARLMLRNPDADWLSFSSDVDIMELNEIVNAYGARMGESSASTGSSADSGGPSRLTSDASTDSASENPVGDQTP